MHAWCPLSSSSAHHTYETDFDDCKGTFFNRCFKYKELSHIASSCSKRFVDLRKDSTKDLPEDSNTPQDNGVWIMYGDEGETLYLSSSHSIHDWRCKSILCLLC